MYKNTGFHYYKTHKQVGVKHYDYVTSVFFLFHSFIVLIFRAAT